jgi:hypothetical protein
VKNLEKDTAIEIHVDPQLLNRITVLDSDISKVVSVALNMWLKERQRLLNCPLTHNLCINVHGSCNECSIVIDS